MPRTAGLLRAVNVGGRKLGMADLRSLTEQAGGTDVATYLQSGNVVFTGPARVAARLEKVLADRLGVAVPVLVRSAEELAAVVAGKPFDAGGSAVSVTFLDREPERAAVAGLDPTAYGADRFAVSGREIYLHTPNGYGRSKLVNSFWERKLGGVVATTRNWNTVVALARLTAG